MQRQGIMELIINKKGEDRESLLEIESNFPFFAWECISIEFGDRNVDLVIRNELHMQILIKFLIITLNTFDSNKNSLDFLKQNKIIKDDTTASQLLNKIYYGYLLIKVRMKISYSACIHSRTLPEHFMQALLTSYEQRCHKGLI